MNNTFLKRLSACCVLAVIICTPPHSQAAAPYFPTLTSDGGNGISEFEAKWYSKHLMAMREPSLLEAARNSSNQVYRLTILPTWGNPIAIRMQKHIGTYELISSRLDGQGGYDPGRLAERKVKNLTNAESRMLENLLAKLKFFELPTDDKINGNDGDQWILEGVSNGKYHVIHRWCPASTQPEKRGLESFLALSRFLVENSALAKPPMNGDRKLLP
jgi:hypothetical protein